MNEVGRWREVETRLRRFPRLRWMRGDTPIQALPRWSELCGSGPVHVKRDDLTALAGGGNKARKLEFLVADAIDRHGADILVTGGAVQSNHCRQTAAAAARTGLGCHLALGGYATGRAQGNFLLDELLGAHIHWCGDDRRGEQLPRIVAELQAQDLRPYLVPYGGSNPTGALGFVAAAVELARQCEEQSLAFDRIVIASSSGGTHAGLLAGLIACGLDVELLGVPIDKELGPEDLGHSVRSIATVCLESLEIETRIPASAVRWLAPPEDAGYGEITAAEAATLRDLARCEGLLLDPVYTVRAMHAWRESAFATDSRTLFWHTGGIPALFADPDALRA